MAKRISEAVAKALFMENDLKPLEPFLNSMQPWRSRCLRCKKIVSPNYNKVRLRGHQCGYCTGNLVDEDDAVKVMKRGGFTPKVPYPGANARWKSVCTKCKKITYPSYSTARLGIGCKYCSHRAVDHKDAAAAMRERGFKVLEPFPGATKPWRVRCLSCKREFTTYFHSLKTTKRCKFCMGVAIDPRTVTLVITKLNLKALEEFPGADVPWKLKCLTCQRESYLRYGHLTRKDRNVKGCPYCSRHKLDPIDIAKFMSKQKLKPISPYVNANSAWECLCLKCKRRVYPRLSDLRKGQTGCIYCAGLKKVESEVIELANKCGFTPLEKYPGANKGWLCRCNVCGKDSRPHYTSMQQSGSGCKFCAIGGFDFNQPAIIYLITNPKLGAHKIGVAGANGKNERLAKHSRGGWELYRKKSYPTGLEAFKVEQKILKWFISKELYPFVAPELMPNGGSSETIDSESIQLKTIWAKVLSLN